MAWRKYGYIGSRFPAKCTVEGCDANHTSGGYCSRHYKLMRETGSLESLPRRNAKGKCTVEGCDAPHAAAGLCEGHYQSQWRKAKLTSAKEGMGRVCAGCGTAVSPSRRIRGDRAFCSRECKEQSYRGSEASRESALRSYYKRRYGLTPDEADALRASGCAICGTTVWNGRFSKGNIDHDHKTGKVRGVLCTSCNAGLGQFKDDPQRLEAAVRYLAKES